MRRLTIFFVPALAVGVSSCATTTPVEQCIARAATAGVAITGQPPKTGYEMDAGAKLIIWPAADGRPEVECSHSRARVHAVRVNNQLVPVP